MRARRSSLFGLSIASLVALVILPAVVNVGTARLPASWERYAWLAWPAALLLATLVIVVEVRRSRQPAPLAADQALLKRAEDDLARAVERQWVAEAEARGLNQPEPIQLMWTVTGRDVTPARFQVSYLDADGPPSTGILADVVDTLLGLEHRHLVVLGAPGAGKTALAITLTLSLLARRSSESLPVPVLLTLSDWDPDREHLSIWVARRLNEEYPALTNTAVYGPDAAMNLVGGGRVLPVLDGLDEMPTDVHAAAIDGIDRAMSPGRPFVLTCRSAEYEDAVRAGGLVLSRALVLEIGPVTAPAAVAYLSSNLPTGDARWRPLLAELERDPGGPLAAALSTPLMVWLVRVVYRARDRRPGELADRRRFGSAQVIEEHLLDALIPTVYAARPLGPHRPRLGRYHAEDASRWFAFLAGHLARLQTRDFAWWRLHHAVPRRLLACVGMAATAAIGGLMLIALVVVPALHPGRTVGAVVFLLAVPTAGLAVGLAGPPGAPVNITGAARGRQRWARIGTGLYVGVGSAVAIGPVAGLHTAVGLVLVGAVVGLFASMFRTPEALTASEPAAVYQRDRLTLASFVAVGSLAGAIGGLLIGPGRTYPGWLLAAVCGATSLGFAAFVLTRLRRPVALPTSLGVLLGGLVGAAGGALARAPFGGEPVVFGAVGGGLGLGLLGGLVVTASGWFAVARGYLAAKGSLPWRLFPFLRDARERGLLRQVGGYYQFRHARLQDRLGERGPST